MVGNVVKVFSSSGTVQTLISIVGLMIVALVYPTAVRAADIVGQIVVKTARDNSNAVVYIDKIPNQRFAPPVDPVVLDQINLTFVPHVLPVLVGTRVAFPNSDEIRHNVFSPGPPRFDLGTYAQKTTKYYVFEKAGVWTLLCNVHAEMSAYIVVTDTPYFARTDKDGKFVLKDVPPGKYSIKVWHEKAKPSTMQVEVSSGTVVNLLPIELKM